MSDQMRAIASAPNLPLLEFMAAPAGVAVLTELTTSAGQRITVDLSTHRTIEPRGDETILHFEDGHTIIVQDTINPAASGVLNKPEGL